MMNLERNFKHNTSGEATARLERRLAACAAGAGATSPLESGLHKRLLAYAAAAGAAGVGLLAAAPAQANIVVTNANTFIQPNHPFFLDLNHDGIADFELGQSFVSSGLSPVMRVKGLLASNGAIGFVSTYFGHTVASRLAGGAPVGPGGKFEKDAILGEARCCFATYYYGPWAHPGSGFLGLRFDIGGQIHFGWAELKTELVGQRRFLYGEELIAYAYDTVPNQAIFAGQGLSEANLPGSAATPEPGTLGLLALGAVGLGFWRRRKGIALREVVASDPA